MERPLPESASGPGSGADSPIAGNSCWFCLRLACDEGVSGFFHGFPAGLVTTGKEAGEAVARFTGGVARGGCSTGVLCATGAAT